MTRDASFKKVVRRHAEDTGQRYTEALTDLEVSVRACTTSQFPSGCSLISGIATALTRSRRRSSACTRPMCSASTALTGARGSPACSPRPAAGRC